MSPLSTKRIRIRRCTIGLTILMCLGFWGGGHHDGSFAEAQEASGSATDRSWIEEIEQVFVPSEQCKQCHDRHYEEWKGMREQTPDLKTFGRVDGALLHGTALKSSCVQNRAWPVAADESNRKRTDRMFILSCPCGNRIPAAH